MNSFSFSIRRSLLLLSSFLISSALVFAAPQQEKGKQVQVPEGERKAAQKIDEAKDTAAKIAAAAAFINKYPKSALRPKIADTLVGQIAGTQDAAQRATLAESYLGTFSEASETKSIYPILIDAYISAKRVDDAFNAAAPWLELNPNEVEVLYALAVTGIDEARRQNPKFSKQSQQYGVKAIELIEADKRPEGISVEQWNKNKAIWLPQLYQSLGLLSFMNGNSAEALPKLEKAAALNPNDPFSFVLLSNLKNEKYMAEAKQLQGTPAGPARTEAEKSLNAQLDEVIDLYAHAIGLMEGKAQYQPLREQLIPDLTNYYKYRHNNSTTGMQELINKYKQPATP